ncbi:hypothetical protein FRC09_005756, partial [Ceratobasidium sp. 395]
NARSSRNCGRNGKRSSKFAETGKTLIRGIFAPIMAPFHRSTGRPPVTAEAIGGTPPDGKCTI